LLTISVTGDCLFMRNLSEATLDNIEENVASRFFLLTVAF